MKPQVRTHFAAFAQVNPDGATLSGVQADSPPPSCRHVESALTWGNREPRSFASLGILSFHNASRPGRGPEASSARILAGQRRERPFARRLSECAGNAAFVAAPLKAQLGFGRSRPRASLPPMNLPRGAILGATNFAVPVGYMDQRFNSAQPVGGFEVTSSKASRATLPVGVCSADRVAVDARLRS